MKLDKLVKKEILEVKSYKPGKPVEEVKRELGLKQVIKLASNENPLGPSPKAIQAISKQLNNIHQYPESSCFYLKQRLAKYMEVNPEQIVVSNGSDEMIVLTLRAFLKPTDKVIIATPSFLIYEIQSKVSGAQVVEVSLKDFRYDLMQMKKAIDSSTKLVFIANPDNPTGSYLTGSEIEEFMDGLPDNLIIYFDEAYYEFAKERSDYPDTLKFIQDRNVIVTRSFSKAYGLAGLRIGYGIANEEIVECLNRVREPFNVNRLAQIGACAALDDEEFLRKTLQTVEEEKSYLYEGLEQLGLKFIPSSTNFILIDLGKNGKEITDKLLKKGIIVRDMKAWRLDNFIRVTIGTHRENKRFIEGLSKIL